jgi:tRNA A22 N-methylase
MTKKLSDEKIVKKQERLYELERDCSTGPPMTEEEQMQRIREFLADDYWEKLLAKAEARRKELEQEILSVSDPKQKERMQRNIELLSTYSDSQMNKRQ